MQITIVGRGRLGRTLAVLLPAAGHAITLVGRHPEVASDCEVVLLCVPDSAVASVARSIGEGPVVLHCSGALDLDVLGPHPKRGSLHPLMTFPGPEVAIPNLSGVPAAISGGGEARETAERLARDLGMDPFGVPGDRRLYHAAAVLAGNYTLALMTEATAWLRAAGVPDPVAAHVLLPLAHRAIENSPLGLHALTGPIARGDLETCATHLTALSEHNLETGEELYRDLLKFTLARLRALDEPPAHND